MKKKTFFAAAITLLVLPAPGSAQTATADLATRIDSMAVETMEKLGAPGLSIAAWSGDELRYAEGFGLARVEDEVPAAAETRYRTASVAKPMTATAVLHLAESGKLDLDAPIRTYCPAFPEKRWPVTARQLLGHTAGIRHPTDAEDETTIHYETIEDALVVFAADSLLNEPGTESNYSTLGYMVLGCAIEGASGRPFMEVLETAVFEPAGMVSTTRDTVPRSDLTRALGYRKDAEGRIEPSLQVDTSFKLAGGGLLSTAADLARFGGALLEGELLSPESRASMLEPVALPGGETTPFGMGWLVGSKFGQKYAIIAGQQEEVSSILLILPEPGIAVALMSNLERHAKELAPLVVQVATAVAGAASPSDPGTP
ncbi:MAG: serine hydrolase domain-containing protein [Gemmatimonadota bacterium]